MEQTADDADEIGHVGSQSLFSFTGMVPSANFVVHCGFTVNLSAFGSGHWIIEASNDTWIIIDRMIEWWAHINLWITRWNWTMLIILIADTSSCTSLFWYFTFGISHPHEIFLRPIVAFFGQVHAIQSGHPWIVFKLVCSPGLSLSGWQQLCEVERCWEEIEVEAQSLGYKVQITKVASLKTCMKSLVVA